MTREIPTVAVRVCAEASLIFWLSPLPLDWATTTVPPAAMAFSRQSTNRADKAHCRNGGLAGGTDHGSGQHTDGIDKKVIQNQRKEHV